MLKKSLKIGVVVISLLLILYFSLITYTANTIKKSAAYKTAITQIEKDKLINSKTGGIVGYGMLPSGNISESDAVLSITVKGKNNDIKVIVFLTKLSDNQWRIYQMMNDFKK